MLVSSKELLKNAIKDTYAVPAYNVNNIEWAKYILEACNEDRSPVILAVSEGTIKYLGGYTVVANAIKALIKELNVKIPVSLHLDHGKSVESCKKAIDAGFTSVMIDSSLKSIDDNIEDTIEVVKYAREKNVGVEGEIGSLDIDQKTLENNDNYVNIDDAKRYVLETGLTSLAPAIGNHHGVYNSDINLDFDSLGLICKETKVPLVLHGASGLDENKIKTAIFCGVAKININTDIQLAWMNRVKEYINENPKEYDPRKIIGSGESEIKRVIHEKNILFGSNNRAN